MKSSLDNLVEISMLMDFYGALLSERQQQIVTLYHEENCSLQEISEELGVSRQGVHEALKKAEKSLQGFEEKLGLVARFRSQEQVLQNALASVDELLGQCEDPGVRQGLLRIKNDINSIYTMADAVFSACFLNTCLRHSDVVDIACISPITNTRGPLFVHPEGIVRRTSFYTMKMYANDLLPFIVPIDTKVGTISLQDDSTKVLDMILTTDKAGEKYVCAIANKDPEKAVSLSVDFKGMGIKTPKKVSARILSGKSADDYNDIGDEHVKPYDAALPIKDGTISVPAHSVTFLFIE